MGLKYLIGKTHKIIYFFPLRGPAGFAALCEFYPVGARAAMPL